MGHRFSRYTVDAPAVVLSDRAVRYPPRHRTRRSVDVAARRGAMVPDGRTFRDRDVRSTDRGRGPCDGHHPRRVRPLGPAPRNHDLGRGRDLEADSPARIAGRVVTSPFASPPDQIRGVTFEICTGRVRRAPRHRTRGPTQGRLRCSALDPGPCGTRACSGRRSLDPQPDLTPTKESLR